MKKRGNKRTLALVMTLALVLGLLPLRVSAADVVTLNVDHGDIRITDTGYRVGGAGETPHTGEYVITGDTQSNMIAVESGAPQITLSQLAVDVSAREMGDEHDFSCAFSISPGASATLTLSGSNTLKSGEGRAGLQVPEGASVTLAGSGSLYAEGGLVGAGIGGGTQYHGKGQNAGSVTIEGNVKITAVGGEKGAGIGGGGGVTRPKITIQNNKQEILEDSQETITGTYTVTHDTGLATKAYSIAGGTAADGDVTTGKGTPSGCLGKTSATFTTNYGTLFVEKDGTWRYELDQESDTLHALKEEETRTETFNVTVTDLYGKNHTQPITIKITGEGGDEDVHSISSASAQASSQTPVFAEKASEDPNAPVTMQGGDGATVVVSGGIIRASSIGGGYGAKNNNSSGNYPDGNSGTLTVLGGIVFQGTTGEVTGDVSLAEDFTLAPGENLLIPESATLTIPKGTTLSVGSSLTNKGTIQNCGTITGNGTLDNTSGTINGDGGGISGITLTGNKATRTITLPGAAQVDVTSVTLPLATPSAGVGDGTVEYGYATTNNSGDVTEWQTGLTFDTLLPNTPYYFFARVTGGTYYADADSAGLSVTTPERSYTIAATPATLDFGSLTEGYGEAPVQQTVTIQNTGNSPVTGYTVTGNTNFDVTYSTAGIPAGDTATFTVRPKAGLAVGTYSETLTITTNENTTTKVEASFTVTARSFSGGGGGGATSATDKAADAISKAKDGDTVKMDLPSNGKLPGKVLEAAAGKDVTLEISAGKDMTWIINGKDLPTGKLADLNLKVDTQANTIPVNVIHALTGEEKVMELALSHSGEFGFTLTLRLDTGKDNAGLFANLYYYNETAKALEYQTTAKIGPDGNADIPFAHASSYAVVIDETSHAPAVWDNPFTDVGAADWFYDAVAYVHQQGLMVGLTDTTFGPTGPVTRAQVWTVLARMDGREVSGGDPWYAPAQTWALANNVSDGTDPDGAVTREQLVTMLYRYAQAEGMEVSVGESTNILSYDDAIDVAEWAIPAFQWACGAGVVSGTSDTTLSPQTGADRAQLATILMGFLENA